MRDMDYGVKLITRAEWGARAPRSVTSLNPSFGATRHWEGPHMGYPWPHESCASKVRGIQNFHMDSRGWSDIAYTGVVCPHGYVFEGRSLWVRTAANGTNVGNNTAYAFCYLGGQGDQFTEDGKRAMRAAMNWTRQWGGAGAGRNDHNDWKPTECPGVVIEAWGDTGEVIVLPTPTPPPPPPPKGRSTAMMTSCVHPDSQRTDWFVIGGDRRVYHYVADTPEAVATLQGGMPLDGQWKSITAQRVGEEIVLMGQGLRNELWTLRYDGTSWLPLVQGPVGAVIAPADNL